jgi:peptide/nickel transport system substrate-binding protein
MYDTYIPLLTYRHASGAAGSEVVPGLAKALPEITDGGRTYVLYLRRGLRYSNGRPVRASDFKWAIERLFRLNSGGKRFYNDIVGVHAFRQTGKSISGIRTDDRTGRIVIHLLKPQAGFSAELAMIFAAPVPQDTPAKDMTPEPPPATGPYEITISIPGLGWAYARNPEWRTHNAKRLPQLPSGHVSQIVMIVAPTLQLELSAIERNRLDWTQELPSRRVAMLRKRYEGRQLRLEPALITSYFWMNTRKPPFDDLRVRQAVNYAIDPAVLSGIFHGQLNPTQQILAPDMPGYSKFELYPHDLAKAKQLIAEANPSDPDVTVWSARYPEEVEANVYYCGVLEELGFHTHLKLLGEYAYFVQTGRPSTHNLDTGSSDWFADYPYPSDYFDPMFGPGSIKPTWNENLAELETPSLSAEITALDEGSPDVSQAGYAALDRRLMELAPWAPFGNPLSSLFVAKRIDLKSVVWNPTFGADLTSFRFK